MLKWPPFRSLFLVGFDGVPLLFSVQSSFLGLVQAWGRRFSRALHMGPLSKLGTKKFASSEFRAIL